MAETKKAKPKSKAKAKARASKRSNGAGAAAKSKSSAAKGSAASKKRRKAPAASSNGGGAAESVKDTVVNGAHGAANGIANGAQKAKLPLLATGAALVGGAAAVIAAKSGGGKHKVLGVSVPKRSKVHVPEVHLPKMPKGEGVKGNVRKAAGAVTDAARQADELGQRISKVASSVQTVSETANDAAKKT